MKLSYWFILPLLGIAYGDPYYYREDKHHSEHHKEYSFSNGQPEGLNNFESSPQKYYESSHYSSHVTPERFLKLETSPTISSGFGEYSAGQSSYQSGFKSGSIQNSHLIPLPAGQSLNIDGIKPGAYVIKQVKIYGHPSVYSSQTGYYGSTHNSEQGAGLGLATGQKEESLYEEGMHSLNARPLQMTSLYHQPLHETKKEESLYGQRIEETGQKEESLYTQHAEDLGQHQVRGDLELGQIEQNVNSQKPHVIKIVKTSPINNGQGYKYYEKKIITYGNPPQDSLVNKQTYIRHESRNIEDLTRKHDGSPIINQSPIGYTQIGRQPNRVTEPLGHQGYISSQMIGKKEESSYAEHKLDFGQKPESGSLEIGQQPVAEGLDIGQQLMTGSLEIGQHSLSEELKTGQQTMPSSFEIGQKPFADDLEFGQKPVVDDLEFGQKPVAESLEFGQKPESERLEFGQKPVVDSLEFGQKQVADSLEFGQKPETESLEFGQKPVADSLEFGQKQVADSLEFGQKHEAERIEFGQKPVVDSLEFGQKPVVDSLEFGQKPDCEGQIIENGEFELGQKEVRESSHIWQRQEDKSKFEMNGLKTVPLLVNQREIKHQGHQDEKLIAGTVNNFQVQPLTLKKNVTETLIVSHVLPKNPKIENVLKNQREKSIYSQNIESELGQMEENGGKFIGQKEEPFQIPRIDQLELGQKEEPIFDTQPSNDKISSSYVKTYHHHESYQSQHTPTLGKEQKAVTKIQQNYDSPIKSGNREIINKNQERDFMKLNRQVEELALQLAMDDKMKDKSYKQETKTYDGNLQTKEREPTTSTGVYVAEIQELGLEKERNNQEATSNLPRAITWETHDLTYQPPLLTSYSSKKHSKHIQINQGYNSQPILPKAGIPGENLPFSQYSGYLSNANYINDQPVQRSHTSGSQFSFSSSGSQDRHKDIDDFLKELDKDIANSNYKQRQQQGSYSAVTPINSGSSGVSYYSQRTVSSSHSSTSTSGTTSGGGAGKSWYQRIGDSIGSGYNQAKDKAKDIVKTVKQSVGYSST